MKIRSSQKKQNVAGAKLHMGHFAFMRAVVQGLDTRQSWNRYLRIEGEHDDIRNVRRTIQRIRDEFAAAARRHSRHGIARLIRIDAENLTDNARPLPSLEEFAVEHGLEDFSQAEQLEHYRTQLGSPPGAQSRRRRIITRQLDALRWLEELVAVPPHRDDPAAFWLHPDLASRLTSVGIHTLDQLARHINGVGYRWWASVPGIGPTKGERIVGWLRTHGASLGLEIGAHVSQRRQLITSAQLQQIVSPDSAVVPLNKFIAPPGLDGTGGRLRAPKEECRIPANNDITALLAWAGHKGAPGSSTQRSYLKEGERFLLWAVLERKKPISSFETADCEAYVRFLADPQPAAMWCAPRGREKWSPLWKPYEGPLSPSARRHAVVVLKNLYNYLVAQRYLVSNPWASIPLPPKEKQHSKGLSTEQWRLLERHASCLPRTSANLRLMFALKLMHGTGLRLGEVVNATAGNLRREGAVARLSVSGRAGKQRQVELGAELLEQLSDYLHTRGLNNNPFSPDNRNTHLLGPAVDLHERAPWSPSHLRNMDPKAGISAGTLYNQMKSLLTVCAEQLPGLNLQERESIKAAATGWLRETAIDAAA